MDTPTFVHTRLGPWLIAVVLSAGNWVAAGEPSQPAEKKPSAQHVDKLIRQLGDRDYFVRQHAQDELTQFGFEAFDALSAAANDDDLEIAARAKYLLRLMRVDWTVESDSPAVKKYLHDYEFIDDDAREVRIGALAGLPGGQGAAALCRLVRFEKSPLLSKTAAIAWLRSQAAAAPPNAAAAETVRKALAGCKRPGAVWLLAWTRLGGQLEAATAEWTRLVDDEVQVAQRTPGETTQEIVAGLIRFQAVHMKALGKSEEAAAATRRLVEAEPDDSQGLAELLQWLLEQKAWRAVDDLAQRFSPRVAEDSGLLYLLAEAYGQQGQKDRAEETAARALGLYPGKNEEFLFLHLTAARRLRERGQFAWARREFEHVVAQGDADQNGYALVARQMMAEMFHDQGQELDAATTLAKLLQAFETAKPRAWGGGNREPKELRARMHYFFACHWEAKNDRAQQRAALDKALEADPLDIEALISAYHLPEQPPEYRPKIVASIGRSAAAIRSSIARQPDESSFYNQFAWLIGNTEGDLDQALRYAQKAVELKPDEGGYVDTLARVYFARGDLENAVNHQIKAAEMDPHSGLIRRQLEFFRKKQAEKKES